GGSARLLRRSYSSRTELRRRPRRACIRQARERLQGPARLENRPLGVPGRSSPSHDFTPAATGEVRTLGAGRFRIHTGRSLELRAVAYAVAGAPRAQATPWLARRPCSRPPDSLERSFHQLEQLIRLVFVQVVPVLAAPGIQIAQHF